MKKNILDIVKWSSVAARIEIRPGVTMSPVYIHYLVSGVRRSEKRLQQVADQVGVSLKDLKEWITRKKLERAKAVGARAHTAKLRSSTNTHRRNGGAFARSNVSKSST